MVLVGPVRVRQDDGAAHGRRARGHLRAASCASATASSTTCRRATATSRWCSRATRSTRTCPCTTTSPSGSRSRRCRRTRSTGACREAADVLGLEPYLKRKPRALSGGQRQRVAMGRAIVREPAAFLMDEPLSNLDAKLRVQTRAEIARLQHELGVTTIYVTHDQVEAMTMGDRVAVMRKGELQQVADAADALRPARQPLRRRLHRQPFDEHARGDARAANGERVTAAPARDAIAPRRRDARRAAGAPGLRRAAWSSSASGPRTSRTPRSSADAPADRRLQGQVELSEALGSEIMVHFRDRRAGRRRPRRCGARGGRRRRRAAEPQPEGGEAIIVGRFGARSRVQEGETVEVAVDTRALHFFDPDTGLGIYERIERSTMSRSTVDLCARRRARWPRGRRRTSARLRRRAEHERASAGSIS